MTKIVALDCETLDLPSSSWSSLGEFGELECHDFTPYDDSVIIERCKDAEIVLSNKVPLMKPVLDSLPNLKLICILATGTNNVDQSAAGDLGIAVRNVPSYSTDSVAQHTLAMLLELVNRTSHYNQSVHNGDWVASRQFCYWHHRIFQLKGKTAGIIGFGQIGRSTANLLNAFGMRIIAYAQNPKNDPPWEGFAWKSIDEIFSEADVISLHCPLTDDNAGFVNRSLLEKCKPDAILINTARGPLINEADLRDALDRGVIGGAALDVLSREPPLQDNPLLDAPNCLITPHIAWASIEARNHLMQITINNIKSFLKA